MWFSQQQHVVSGPPPQAPSDQPPARQVEAHSSSPRGGAGVSASPRHGGRLRSWNALSRPGLGWPARIHRRTTCSAPRTGHDGSSVHQRAAVQLARPQCMGWLVRFPFPSAPGPQSRCALTRRDVSMDPHARWRRFPRAPSAPPRESASTAARTALDEAPASACAPSISPARPARVPAQSTTGRAGPPSAPSHSARSRDRPPPCRAL